MSVIPSIASPDGFIVHSHAGDDWRDCHKYVCTRLGIAPFPPQSRPLTVAPELSAVALTTIGIAPQHAPQPPQKDDDAEEKHALAMRIWEKAIDPRGTLVEQYLKSRKLELPDEAANEAIRFHPACQFGSERLRAMVCLVRNIITNEPQAIHRTALMPDAIAINRNGKTFRLSLGPVTNGAIKLDPDEDVTQGLCIGEGVESTLSGRQFGYRPAWSVLSTGGISEFPVFPAIRGLTMFGERDAKGQSEKAISACAERWLAAGIETRAAWSLVGGDLNDEIKGTP